MSSGVNSLKSSISHLLFPLHLARKEISKQRCQENKTSDENKEMEKEKKRRRQIEKTYVTRGIFPLVWWTTGRIIFGIFVKGSPVNRGTGWRMNTWLASVWLVFRNLPGAQKPRGSQLLGLHTRYKFLSFALTCHNPRSFWDTWEVLRRCPRWAMTMSSSLSLSRPTWFSAARKTSKGHRRAMAVGGVRVFSECFWVCLGFL